MTVFDFGMLIIVFPFIYPPKRSNAYSAVEGPNTSSNCDILEVMLIVFSLSYGFSDVF